MYLEGTRPFPAHGASPFQVHLPATDVHPDNHPFGASCVY